jgi:hypothetical protein
MIVIEMLKEGVVNQQAAKSLPEERVRGKPSASYTLEHRQGTMIFFDRNDVEPRARWSSGRTAP